MTPPIHRVLIVDDDADTLELLRMAVEEMPYESTLVPRGIDALIEIFEAYKQEKPFNVLVLDCAMPLVDGFTVAKIVRLLERSDITTQRMRIGFFTGFPETVEQSTLLQEVGADAYWRKPDDAQNLPHLIASWLKVEVKRDANLPTRSD